MMEEKFMVSIELSPGRVYMGKIEGNQDLLEVLNGFCLKHHIRLGRIDAIGSVKRAVVGFYDQQLRHYQLMEIAKSLEILSLTGNISLKEKAPFLHAHITLSDEDGRVVGGHLATGTIVFACEFIIQEYVGGALNREPDGETGLPLWAMKRPSY